MGNDVKTFLSNSSTCLSKLSTLVIDKERFRAYFIYMNKEKIIILLDC